MTKKLAAVFVLVVAACVLLLMQPAVTASNANVKYDICHVPPGNPANAHIVDVDASAWDNGHSPHNSHDMDVNCTLDPADCPQACGGTACPLPPPGTCTGQGDFWDPSTCTCVSPE